MLWSHEKSGERDICGHRQTPSTTVSRCTATKPNTASAHLPFRIQGQEGSGGRLRKKEPMWSLLTRELHSVHPAPLPSTAIGPGDHTLPQLQHYEAEQLWPPTLATQLTLHTHTLTHTHVPSHTPSTHTPSHTSALTHTPLHTHLHTYPPHTPSHTTLSHTTLSHTHPYTHTSTHTPYTHTLTCTPSRKHILTHVPSYTHTHICPSARTGQLSPSENEEARTVLA